MIRWEDVLYEQCEVASLTGYLYEAETSKDVSNIFIRIFKRLSEMFKKTYRWIVDKIKLIYNSAKDKISSIFNKKKTDKTKSDSSKSGIKVTSSVIDAGYYTKVKSVFAKSMEGLRTLISDKSIESTSNKVTGFVSTVKDFKLLVSKGPKSVTEVYTESKINSMMHALGNDLATFEKGLHIARSLFSHASSESDHSAKDLYKAVASSCSMMISSVGIHVSTIRKASTFMVSVSRALVDGNPEISDGKGGE